MSAHEMRVDFRPFGGTKSQPKTGTMVRVTCSCGKSTETGDNYGLHDRFEVAAWLKQGLHGWPGGVDGDPTL